MNTTFLASMAVGVALLTPTSAVEAGPLKAEYIGADSKWVLHVDIEAITQSTLGEYILEHAEELDVDLGNLEEFEQETGIDPLTDLFDITIQGGPTPEEDGVIICHMNASVDGIPAVLEQEVDSYRQLSTGGYVIHSWKDGGDRLYGHIHPGSGDDDRLVFLAGNKATLVNAIKVVDGAAPNSTTGHLAEQIRPRAGTLAYFVAADVPELVEVGDDDPAAMIARGSDRVAVNLGEAGEDTFIYLAVSARSEEDARNIGDVLRGVCRAFGRILAEENPDFAPMKQLADTITITTEGDEISVEMRESTAAMMEFIGLVAEHHH